MTLSRVTDATWKAHRDETFPAVTAGMSQHELGDAVDATLMHGVCFPLGARQV